MSRRRVPAHRSILECPFHSDEAVRAVTTAQHRIPDHDPVAGGALRIRLQPALCPTEDQFYEFCRLNRELRIERGAEGEVTIMPPAGWESARRNAVITAQLQVWATRDGSGTAADSSAGYVLPNGAMHSPDASWVNNARLASVTAAAALALSPAVSGLRDRAAFPGGPPACPARQNGRVHRLTAPRWGG